MSDTRIGEPGFAALGGGSGGWRMTRRIDPVGRDPELDGAARQGRIRMELPDMIDKYQQMKAQAERFSSHGSLAELCGMVLDDVADLNLPRLERSMKVEEAASVLGMKPKTIRQWCRDGKFKGALKTSEEGGDWRIPASAVYEMAGLRRKSITPL